MGGCDPPHARMREEGKRGGLNTEGAGGLRQGAPGYSISGSFRDSSKGFPESSAWVQRGACPWVVMAASLSGLRK